MAAPGHADHIVDLHLAAGADAEAALDAGVEVHADGDVAVIEKRDAGLFQRRQAALLDALRLGHVPEVARRVMRVLPRRLVRREHFHDHLAGSGLARFAGGDDHALGGRADAGGGEGPLSFDRHHAGTAVPVGAVAGRVFVA